MTGLPPIRALWQNVDGFFERFLARHGTHMRCAGGCFACCHTDITVSGVEAAQIHEWFTALDSASRDQVIKAWEAQDASKRPDAAGVPRPPCAMLSGGLCTIYPVRPVICRTQGLAMLYRPVGEVDTLAVDVCPLNFTASGSLPAREKWLDLDRLNALLAIAARAAHDALPASILARLDPDGRIALSSLRGMCIEGRQRL